MKTRFLTFINLRNMWSAKHPLYPDKIIQIRSLEGMYCAFIGETQFTTMCDSAQDAASFASLAVHSRLVECAHGTMKNLPESDDARRILKEITSI